MTRQKIRFILIIAILWVAFGLLDLLIPHTSDLGTSTSVAENPFWLKVPGFFSILGLVSCIGLILLAKGLGNWLQRGEGYYDD